MSSKIKPTGEYKLALYALQIQISKGICSDDNLLTLNYRTACLIAPAVSHINDDFPDPEGPVTKTSLRNSIASIVLFLAEGISATNPAAM